MITVFDIYKVLQPLHKKLYAMRDIIPRLTKLTTSNFVVSVHRNGLLIRLGGLGGGGKRLIFDCVISATALMQSTHVIQPDLCRIKFDLNGKIADEQFCGNIFDPHNSIMLNIPLTEEQHFQASLLGDIMKFDDMISMFDLVGDIVSEPSVLKALNESIDVAAARPIIVLNYYNTFNNLSDSELDMIVGEVVPVLNQFISEFQ